jgi:hypothetical protein
MNYEQIWRGTMFVALPLTMKHRYMNLRIVYEKFDPENPKNRWYLYHNSTDYLFANDDGYLCDDIEVNTGMTAVKICRKPPFEERTMSLLSAMAYAQQKGLTWLETKQGTKYSASSRIYYSNCVPVAGTWQEALEPYNTEYEWLVPGDALWTPLNIADVKELETSEATDLTIKQEESNE